VAAARSDGARLQAATEALGDGHRGNAALVPIEGGRVSGEHYASIGRPVGRDRLFQVASLTKWVTARGLMRPPTVVAGWNPPGFVTTGVLPIHLGDPYFGPTRLPQSVTVVDTARGNWHPKEGGRMGFPNTLIEFQERFRLRSLRMV
jgi:hypothetical protein